MYERNEWSENKNFSLKKIAQDVMNKKSHSNINTSCCIDTTKITAGPCTSDITSSCCIDTLRE